MRERGEEVRSKGVDGWSDGEMGKHSSRLKQLTT